MDNKESGKIHRQMFGASREEDGNPGWGSPENVGQVDLGF
jgi:hypothetical protein